MTDEPKHVITATVYSVTLSLTAADLAEARPVFTARLLLDEQARRIAMFDPWDTLAAEMERDASDARLRSEAAEKYRAITDELVERVNVMVRARGRITAEERDALLAEHKRRCAAVPNPPRRDPFGATQEA